jgi:hypothetical protein
MVNAFIYSANNTNHINTISMPEQDNHLKVVEESALSFTIFEGTDKAKKYFIETGLSMERLTEYQQLEIEIGYGYTLPEMHKKHVELYETLNKNKLADASVKAYDLVNSIKQAQSRVHPIIRLCALFMNTENEDRGKITQEMIEEKIEDWKEAKIDTRFFFRFAEGIIGTYMESSSADTPKTAAENQAQI